MKSANAIVLMGAGVELGTIKPQVSWYATPFALRDINFNLLYSYLSSRTTTSERLIRMMTDDPLVFDTTDETVTMIHYERVVSAGSILATVNLTRQNITPKLTAVSAVVRIWRTGESVNSPEMRAFGPKTLKLG